MDDKYVVFKSEDTQTLSDVCRHMRVMDAVVIRTQDVFAAAGLAAYAQNIRTQVALMRTALLPDMTDSFHALEATEDLVAADQMIERLEATAAYFEGCAQEAEERIARGECKVPD